MFAIICLFVAVICLAMTFCCIEVKARGWWLWAFACGFFIFEFAQQINS